jgi:large subunit ribosomal protein L17
MRKLGRTTDQRRALLKSLAANLILKEKIKTSEARAKEMRSLVEHLITQSQKNNLAARRYVASALPADAAQKLYREVAPRLVGRHGGFTKITRLGQRLTDGAKMVFIEIVK